MKKMRKILLGGILMSLLLVGIASASYAYSYYWVYTPPFAGCAHYNGPGTATGNPYVNPNYQTTKTTYCIVAANSNKEQTNYIKTMGPGRISFTKQSWYSKGAKYRMVSYPSSQSFLSYSVEVTWAP